MKKTPRRTVLYPRLFEMEFTILHTQPIGGMRCDAFHSSSPRRIRSHQPPYLKRERMRMGERDDMKWDYWMQNYKTWIWMPEINEYVWRCSFRISSLFIYLFFVPFFPCSCSSMSKVGYLTKFIRIVPSVSVVEKLSILMYTN